MDSSSIRLHYGRVLVHKTGKHNMEDLVIFLAHSYYVGCRHEEAISVADNSDRRAESLCHWYDDRVFVVLSDASVHLKAKCPAWVLLPCRAHRKAFYFGRISMVQNDAVITTWALCWAITATVFKVALFSSCD